MHRSVCLLTSVSSFLSSVWGGLHRSVCLLTTVSSFLSSVWGGMHRSVCLLASVLGFISAKTAPCCFQWSIDHHELVPRIKHFCPLSGLVECQHGIIPSSRFDCEHFWCIHLLIYWLHLFGLSVQNSCSSRVLMTVWLSLNIAKTHTFLSTV